MFYYVSGTLAAKEYGFAAVDCGKSAVAAAAKNDNDCKDNDPSAVVVKKMA